jgi:hypothetical protein
MQLSAQARSGSRFLVLEFDKRYTGSIRVSPATGDRRTRPAWRWRRRRFAVKKEAQHGAARAPCILTDLSS